MKVIVSHMNLDFDGLASMVAAHKLYPDAAMAISDKVHGAVKRYLAIYRDRLSFVPDHTIAWHEVTQLIVVDVASLQRVGSFTSELKHKDLTCTLFDHHPPEEGDIVTDDRNVEEVGATITLLLEEIERRGLEVSAFEATLFGLGLYTDTGSFTYSNTTPRDLRAAAYLLERGMSLGLVDRFSNAKESQEQQLFSQLLLNQHEVQFDGLHIVISTHEQDTFQGGLSMCSQHLLEMTGADAVIIVAAMHKRVYVVGRASSQRINLLPLMGEFGGGGHEQAASANVKNGKLAAIVDIVRSHIPNMVKPAITAEILMVSPVKTVPPETTIEEAANLMYRYGHTGLPVVAEGKVVGIISRRDLDKAKHHGLGHAPVKAYMSSNVITVGRDTSFEEILNTMIKHDIGRLPVMDGEKLVGILSRTNVIEVLHNDQLKKELQNTAALAVQHNLRSIMKKRLPPAAYHLLRDLGKIADDAMVKAYLIGGIVRDILLERDNDDVDIMIEGDGVGFAQAASERYGGEVKIHESFGTSTWRHPNGMRIDFTSSRFEYYEYPAALPTVEYASLREDLSRRDFTVNAMAIRLNAGDFGEIVDYFNGREHIRSKRITILHNLSFVEDPTRILRAVRFETRLGFTMDGQTLKLAEMSMDKLSALSKTRMANELHKLFTEEHALRSVQRLFEIHCWKVLIPQPIDEETVMSHGRNLDAEVQSGDWRLDADHFWFCFLLLPFYGQKDWSLHAAPYALHRRHVKLVEEIERLEQLWPALGGRAPSDLHSLLKTVSDDAILFFLSHPDRERELELGRDYVLGRRALRPLLTGEDLKAMHIQPGPIYTAILTELEAAYLDGEVTNKEEAVLWVKNRM